MSRNFKRFFTSLRWKLAFFALALSQLSAAGQSHPASIPGLPWHPLFYIGVDSNWIQATIISINPNDIENIRVDNHFVDSARNINGRIFITMKKGTHLFSLQDLANQHHVGQGVPMIFLVDDAWIKDTTGYRVESSFVSDVQIVSTLDFSNLKNNGSPFFIVKIKTLGGNPSKTAPSKSNPGTVRIRGDISFR